MPEALAETPAERLCRPPRVSCLRRMRRDRLGPGRRRRRRQQTRYRRARTAGRSPCGATCLALQDLDQLDGRSAVDEATGTRFGSEARGIMTLQQIPPFFPNRLGDAAAF